MTNMKKWNYVIAAVMAILGAAVAVLSLRFPLELGSGDPGPGFWPAILGGLLIFLSVLLAVMTGKNREKETKKEFALSTPANKSVYVFMVLIVGFCAVMYFLGFLAACLFFLPVAMRLLGVTDKKMLILADVATVAAIYIVFVLLLKTPLPEPIFMR